MTPKLAVIICLSLNIESVIGSLIPLFGVHRFSPELECIFVDVYDYYYLMYVGISFFICIVLYGILYALIGRTALLQKRKILSLTLRHVPTSLSIGQMKAVKNLMVVLTVFIICVLPYVVNNARIIRPEPHTPHRGYLSDAIELLTLTLLLINSAINPVIYAVKIEKFRKAFKYILCRLQYSIESQT